MKRVFQAEYKGDLSPYDYERKALAEMGVDLEPLMPRCSGSNGRHPLTTPYSRRSQGAGW
jgi:hypothetical protein